MAAATYSFVGKADMKQHNEQVEKARKEVSKYADEVKKAQTETTKLGNTNFSRAYTAQRNLQTNIKNTTNVLNGFNRGILGSVSKFGVYGAAAAAGIGVAFKAAKEIIKESDTWTDKFDGTIKGLKNSVSQLGYQLGQLDFSNLIENMRVAYKNAKELRDAMDDLTTFNLINEDEVDEIRTQLMELRVRSRRGENVEALIKQKEEEYKKALNAAVPRIQDTMQKAMNEALNWNPNGTNFGWSKAEDLWDAVLENKIKKTDELTRRRKELQRKIDGMTRGLTNAQQASMGEAWKKELKGYNKELHAIDLALKITDDEIKSVNDQRQNLRNIRQEIASTELKDTRYLKGGKTDVKVKVEPDIPEGSIAAVEKKLQDLKQQYNLATTDEGEGGRNELKKKIEDAEKELQILKGELEDLPEGSVAKIQKELQQLKLDWSLAPTDEKRAEIQQRINEAQAKLDRINGVTIETKLKIDDGSVADLQDKIAEKKKEMEASGDLDFIIKCKLEIEGWEADIKRITEATKTPVEKVNESIEKMSESYKNAGEEAQAWGNAVGEAFNFMAECSDNETAKVLKGFATISSQIAQMIPQIVSLVAANEAKAMAAGVAGAAEVPYPGSIGAIASVVAELMAVFSTIASISKFADGGIVAGNHRIGDMNLVRVNSGEMILNGSQQAKLFRMLNGGANIGGSTQISGDVRFEIEGSKLVGVLGNYERKIGRVRP